jgi:hypothetical protein
LEVEGSICDEDRSGYWKVCWYKCSSGCCRSACSSGWLSDGGGVSIILGIGVSTRVNDDFLGGREFCECSDGGISNDEDLMEVKLDSLPLISSSKVPWLLEGTELLCCVLTARRRPGREKFSVMGSVCTLDKEKEWPEVELIGDDMGDSSPSVSLLILAPARLEKGTLSPLRRLPLRYVVRVDLRRPTPGAAGKMGMSSLAGTSIPASCRKLVSRVNFCIALDGSLTSSSSSLRSERFNSGPPCCD